MLEQRKFSIQKSLLLQHHFLAIYRLEHSHDRSFSAANQLKQSEGDNFLRLILNSGEIILLPMSNNYADIANLINNFLVIKKKKSS
jgi:hypothetical protein